MNEIIGGGNQKTETFLKTASSLDSVLPLSYLLFRGDETYTEKDRLFDLLDLIPQGEFSNKWLETAPFKLINDGDSLKNDSTKWFTNNPAWMENQYYGFQGSVGLVSVLDNIRNNIEKNDISKISEILKIDSKELKWLKRQYSSRQDRMPNRTVITLALLHLNRSLLGPIPVR